MRNQKVRDLTATERQRIQPLWDTYTGFAKVKSMGMSPCSSNRALVTGTSPGAVPDTELMHTMWLKLEKERAVVLDYQYAQQVWVIRKGKPVGSIAQLVRAR